MNLQEMQARVEKAVVTEDALCAVSPIYCLLGFEKGDFCNLIDAIGLSKWVEAADRWRRLDKAEQEYAAKQKYLQRKARLEELRIEQEELAEMVERYEKANRLPA